MQRLIIRLAIVALMVSCGVYLIVQSQLRSDLVASQDEENLVLPPRPPARQADPIAEPGTEDAAADVYDDTLPADPQALYSAEPSPLAAGDQAAARDSRVQPSAYQQESTGNPAAPPPAQAYNGSVYGDGDTTLDPSAAADSNPAATNRYAASDPYGDPYAAAPYGDTPDPASARGALSDGPPPSTLPPATAPPSDPTAAEYGGGNAGDLAAQTPPPVQQPPAEAYPAADVPPASADPYGGYGAVDPYNNALNDSSPPPAAAPPEAEGPSATISGLAPADSAYPQEFADENPEGAAMATLGDTGATDDAGATDDDSAHYPQAQRSLAAAPGLGEFQDAASPPQPLAASDAAPAAEDPLGQDSTEPLPPAGEGFPPAAVADVGDQPNAQPLAADAAPPVSRIPDQPAYADDGGGGLSGGPPPQEIAPRSPRASNAALAVPPAAVNGLAASPLPGDAELEGRLTPTVTIEKRAPEEVQVGRTTQFSILVRNDGQVAAQDVMVIDRVPQGAKFAGAEPDAQRTADGALVWSLGELPPGETRELVMQFIPQTEGELGSVARVVFQTAASARTTATRPALMIKHSGPDRVLLGQDVTYAISISNPGSGAAYGVILEADIPEGLSHPRGNALEYAVGMLKPGETRSLQLTLRAEKPGLVTNRLAVRGDGDLSMEDSSQLEITAPRLVSAIEGPSKRYVNRPARFAFQLNNAGTAAAREVELVAQLPPGMKFQSANNHGEYDPRRHAVYWNLVELAAGKNDSVEMIAVPVETGQHVVTLTGQGALGVSIAEEHLLEVFTLNELSFTVADVADPIEVGSQTTYEIRVTNQGSKADSNVTVQVQLPQGMQPQPATEGQQYSIQQQIIAFPAVQSLAPNDTVTLRFQALGKAAGDHRVRVQVVSKESPTPVIKEEATRVYEDR